MADGNARYEIPFITRILRLLVRTPPFCPSCDSYKVYRLYFPGVLVGPYLEFATYSSLIAGSSFNVTSVGSSEPRSSIPMGRNRTAYRKMLFALGYLGIYMGLSPKISFQTSVTDWFLEQSLLSRFVPFF
jgi:lysophospholipid acyltransferase